MIDRFRLPFVFDAAGLQADLAALSAEGWIPHFNTGFHDGQWSGLVLRGPTDVTDSLLAVGEAFADTPLMALCPAVRNVLDTLKCPPRSVRLLRLGPGGIIREHRDYGLGPQEGEVRLHVPVKTNPDVRFHLRNRLVAMAEGETWYLDLGQPHRVSNAGTEDRIHLVIDVALNDWLRDLIPFEVAAPLHPPPPTMDVATALANLERFRTRVDRDEALHAQLRDTTDRDLFAEECVRIGAELGLPFTVDAVRGTIADERGRWHAQWMK